MNGYQPRSQYSSISRGDEMICVAFSKVHKKMIQSAGKQAVLAVIDFIFLLILSIYHCAFNLY